MTIDEVRGTIKKVCHVVTDFDAEQVLESILAKGEMTGDKSVDFENITKDWGEAEWKKVLKEYYLSFSNSNLATITFDALGLGDKDRRIDDQKHVSSYKKAPDNYYLYMINYEVDKLPGAGEGTSCSGGDLDKVLTSACVALEHGDNYGTVCYPPDVFIKEVAGLNVSRADFYQTLKEVADGKESLEKLLVDAKNRNASLATQMSGAYNRLLGNTKVETKSSKKKFGNKIDFAGLLEKPAALFKKLPEIKKNIWRICFIVNTLSLAVSLILYILSWTVNTSIATQTNGFFDIPVIGWFVGLVVTMSSQVATAAKMLTEVAARLFVALLSLKVLKKQANPQKKDSVTGMLLCCLVLIATVFSLLTFVMIGVNVYRAKQQGKAFWAYFFAYYKGARK